MRRFPDLVIPETSLGTQDLQLVLPDGEISGALVDGGSGLLLGETLSARELVGCALMFTGVIASQCRRCTDPATQGE